MFNLKSKLFIASLFIAGGVTAEVKHATNGKEVINHAKNKHTVAMVHAEWCGFCKKAKPEFEKMSNDPNLKDIIFVDIESDKDKNFASSNNVTGLPTFLIFEMGTEKPVDRVVGFNPAAIEIKLKKLAAGEKLEGSKPAAKPAAKPAKKTEAKPAKKSPARKQRKPNKAKDHEAMQEQEVGVGCKLEGCGSCNSCGEEKENCSTKSNCSSCKSSCSTCNK